MDKFDAFIKQNRQLFDTEDLPARHFDRFSKKMTMRRSSNRINLWLVAGAAAVVGLILTASLSLLLNLSGLTPSQESGLASVSLSPELIQIDEYYQYELTQKQLMINGMMTGNMTPLEKEIEQAINDMNEGYESILSDMVLIPRTEIAAFVLTRFYQVQLDVLDGIITRMQGVASLNQ